MDRVLARRRILDAQVVGQVIAGDVVAEAPFCSQEFEARLHGVVAAAEDPHRPAEVDVVAVLGLDLDDAGRALAKLRRQGAGDKIYPVDEAGIDRLSEAGDAFGQLRAIDAVLHIRVLVAHMQRPRGLRVQGDPRKAQQDVVHRRVRAEGEVLDELLVDAIDGGADLRRELQLRFLQTLGRYLHRGQDHDLGGGQSHRGRVGRGDGNRLGERRPPAGRGAQRIGAGWQVGKDRRTRGIGRGGSQGIAVRVGERNGRIDDGLAGRIDEGGGDGRGASNGRGEHQAQHQRAPGQGGRHGKTFQDRANARFAGSRRTASTANGKCEAARNGRIRDALDALRWPAGRVAADAPVAAGGAGRPA